MAHKQSIGRKAAAETCEIALAWVEWARPQYRNIEIACALADAWRHFAETGWLPLPDGHPKQGAERGIGRKASPEAIDAAAKLLDTYTPALTGPNFSYCVNPEGYPEDQVDITADMAARALFENLERLATTGWLVETRVELETFLIRELYKGIRADEDTSKMALERLGRTYPRSTRDLERQTRGLGPKGKQKIS